MQLQGDRKWRFNSDILLLQSKKMGILQWGDFKSNDYQHTTGRWNMLQLPKIDKEP